MPMSQHVLRQRLQNILNEEQGKLHETKVVQLASHCHGAFIEPMHFSSQKLQAFNCFMYVLNLVDRVEPNIFEIGDKKFGFFVNSSFFTKLYDADILSETSIDQLETNDLVVYYKGLFGSELSRLADFSAIAAPIIPIGLVRSDLRLLASNHLDCALSKPLSLTFKLRSLPSMNSTSMPLALYRLNI